jgi:hypothetical protein
VVSAADHILSHPDDRFEYPSARSHLTSLDLARSTRRLVDRWHTVASGIGEGVDFASGQPAQFHFVRVPAAQWTVVLVTFPPEK